MMVPRNKLIVIEGGDGAGKKTQAMLALAALNGYNAGYHPYKPATYLDFPRYESSIAGSWVGRALKGEFGDFRNLDPHLAAPLYALDRVGAKPDLLRAMEHGVALCDRYVASNAIYQAAKLYNHEQRFAFVRELEMLEYDELWLPRPDLTIYLHVPAEISRELARQRAAEGGGVLDQHEADVAYQQSVVDLYVLKAKSCHDWTFVECAPEGTLLSKEAIHELIMPRIKGVLEM